MLIDILRDNKANLNVFKIKKTAHKAQQQALSNENPENRNMISAISSFTLGDILVIFIQIFYFNTYNREQ